MATSKASSNGKGKGKGKGKAAPIAYKGKALPPRSTKAAGPKLTGKARTEMLQRRAAAAAATRKATTYRIKLIGGGTEILNGSQLAGRLAHANRTAASRKAAATKAAATRKRNAGKGKGKGNMAAIRKAGAAAKAANAPLAR